MKIIKAFPPNFSDIAAHFPVKGHTGILYAFGELLYNPSGYNLMPWLIDHEEVHGKRQLSTYLCDSPSPDSVLRWWRRYMNNPRFRLNEEILAHQAEWKSYLKHTSNKTQQQFYLAQMVERLSGPLYGKLITPSEAAREITGVNG